MFLITKAFKKQLVLQAWTAVQGCEYERERKGEMMHGRKRGKAKFRV